jgi:hypothetical protein
MGLFIARGLMERRPAGIEVERSRLATDPHLIGRSLPSLEGAAGWIGAPMARDSLAGRVVAVVFWSSTQPLSWRLLEDARAAHDAYARYGLSVVGVHVPEFAFAAESAHVAATARRLGLRFPVALDPSLRVSSAFGSRGDRPRVVLADASGAVVADRQGSDALTAMGGTIRAQLEARSPGVRFPLVPVGVDEQSQLAKDLVHPPVHLGRARVQRGPLADTAPGRPVVFAAQIRQQVEGAPYTPYPVGRWILGGDGLTAVRGGAQNFVALRYDAGSLGAVLGPPESGAARVWVLRDEKWLGPEELGEDMRLDGRGASYVDVTEPRLYSLCRETAGQHVVKLSPEEPGVTFYAFTFESWGRVPGQ